MRLSGSWAPRASRFTMSALTYARAYSSRPKTISRCVGGCVVQDWAGPIGLGFAGWRPDLISELIICNTWAWPAQGIKHFENWSRLTGGGLGRFLIVRFNAFTGLLVPMSMNRKLTRAERAAYAKPYPTPASRIPHSHFAREILESRNF